MNADRDCYRNNAKEVNEVFGRFKNMSFSSKAIQNPSKNCEKSLEIFDSHSHYLLHLFAR